MFKYQIVFKYKFVDPVKPNCVTVNVLKSQRSMSGVEFVSYFSNKLLMADRSNLGKVTIFAEPYSIKKEHVKALGQFMGKSSLTL